MNPFLQEAIQLAIDNVHKGGTPYGAVLVKDNVIIGRGTNTLHEAYDISGHAEMIAILEGQNKLQTNDLEGCVMYASGHPCPMCFGALAFVGISEVFYANSLEDAKDANMGLSLEDYNYLAGKESSLDMIMTKVDIEDDKNNPMLIYKETLK